MFGFIFGGGDYNHYKNTYDKEIKTSDVTKQGFLDSLHQVNTSNVRITGNITIISNDDMPKEAYVFAEVTTIKYQDGTFKSVVSSTPLVAQLTTGPDRKQRMDPTGLDLKQGQVLDFNKV